MIDLNSPEMSFRTEKEVETYSRFFLSTNPIDSEHEFPSSGEYDDFVARRERQLKAQLDLLRNLEFSKANVRKIEQHYHRLVKRAHSEPLSSIGAHRASSRFNYKDITLLKNRSIYFGRTKKCCEIEKFHLESEKEMIRKAFQPGYSQDESEIPFAEHLVKQYRVSLENVLVLTSKPSMDAIGVTSSAFMNEWYDLNETYEIPTASQVLGTLARIHGYKGILYNSVRYQIENNLVVFEENTGELKFEELESQIYTPSSEFLESSLACL